MQVSFMSENGHDIAIVDVTTPGLLSDEEILRMAWSVAQNAHDADKVQYAYIDDREMEFSALSL